MNEMLQSLLTSVRYSNYEKSHDVVHCPCSLFVKLYAVRVLCVDFITYRGFWLGERNFSRPSDWLKQRKTGLETVLRN